MDDTGLSDRRPESLQQQSMEGLIDAGVSAAKRGRPQEAFSLVGRAAKLYPNRYEPHYLQGCMLASDGQHENAIQCFERALQAEAPDIEVTQALVFSLRQCGRFVEAEALARKWSVVLPHDATARAALAHIFMEQNRLDDALTQAQHAAFLAPGNIDALILVAGILAQLGRTAQAIKNLIAARKHAPMRADLHLHLGNVLKIEGRFDEARAAFQQALNLDSTNSTALLALAEITRILPDDPLLAKMEKLAAREPAIPPPESHRLHFALGKAYDDLDRIESAFRHFAIGNARERAKNRYDEKATLAALARLQDIVSPAFVDHLKGLGHHSELPIFIVGMPRSGTTLIEQILASHPRVVAGGELHHFHQSVDAVLAPRSTTRSYPDTLSCLLPRDLSVIAERYLSRLTPLADGGLRVTDKLPANALLAGIIHLALPKAKIIHCVRDPKDTCLSCFKNYFGPRVPYSTDLGALGRYYRAQTRLMAHWRTFLPAESFLDVQYEEMVFGFEGQVRRLLSYCGLDWDERCLSFHRVKNSVNTASAVQVREPLYKSSVGRWRRYEAYLGALLSALGETVP